MRGEGSLTRARDFIGRPSGRWAAVVFTAAAVAGLAFALYAAFGDSEAVASSRQRVFVCAQSGKSFRHEIAAGEVIPVRSPHSGGATGYPAELCYWMADGTVKDEPTAVLLNSYLGQAGATFCPDCDRLVVGHNPPAEPGAKPPPLRHEYKPPKKDPQDER